VADAPAPVSTEPAPEAYQAFLEEKLVYEPFFGKLAAAGIVPASEEQALALLEIGDTQLRLYDAELQKQAAAQSDEILDALADLRAYAGTAPEASGAGPAVVDPQILKAARALQLI
jgi:hypothetical protein